MLSQRLWGVSITNNIGQVMKKPVGRIDMGEVLRAQRVQPTKRINK